MMKSQHNLVLASAFFISLLVSQTASASHAAGAEITYQHLAGNNYIIHVAFYRDCFGIAAPASMTVQVSSVQCALNYSLTLLLVPGTGAEVTLPCQGTFTTCNGGTQPGFQKWEYENTFAFPAQCSDWLIAMAVSARNAAITTMQNPGSADLYVEARLNNSGSDNSSPVFSIDPVFMVCMNQNQLINYGLLDADGDSLVYSLVDPLVAANTPVSYNPGYSGQQPLSSNPSMSMNPLTGDLYLNPVAVEVGSIAYKVMDYRNGELMGSIVRDVIIYSIPCNDAPPECSGVNGTQLMNICVLPEQAFCFSIFSTDEDSTDSLQMTWNNGIPSAAFFTFGSQHPTGTFCWTPSLSDVRPQPYTFAVLIRDNVCPNNGTQVFCYHITVTLDSSLVTPFYNHGYVSGNVYYDINGNGIKDTGEHDLKSLRVNSQPDNLGVFTNTQGDYIFYTMTNGAHTITPEIPSDWMITSDSASYNFADDTLDRTGFDFGMNSILNYNQLEVSITSGFPRCNNIVPYYINYENTGTTLADGRVLFVIDQATSFISSVPVPDLINGDSLYFNFTALWPYSLRQINVSLLLPGAGTVLHHALYIEYDSLGAYYVSGEQALQQTVSCSYDPNDKSVQPEGLFGNHAVAYDEFLYYTIRFQNTGNDTAFNVVIKDLIDPGLDLNTFHLTGSSHEVNTTIYPNRMVEFSFHNILLPDSVIDEPSSHGYIQYRIRPDQHLQMPFAISNTAYIFFDSNPPVQTNAVNNTVVSDLFVNVQSPGSESNQVRVVPNPFHEKAEIIFDKTFQNNGSEFRLMNVLGELLVKTIVTGSGATLTKGNLRPGIYFYELKNSSGNRAAGKLAIE